MLGHICCQDHVNDGGTHGTILCSVRVKGCGERSEEVGKRVTGKQKKREKLVGRVRERKELVGKLTHHEGSGGKGQGTSNAGTYPAVPKLPPNAR